MQRGNLLQSFLEFAADWQWAVEGVTFQI